MMQTNSSSLRQRRSTLALSPLESARKPAEETLFKAEDVLKQRYTIRNTIGQGTTSVVYRAERLLDGRQVAVKSIKTLDFETEQTAKREYDLLKSLRHPNIIDALDYYALPARAVLVLDFVDGVDLKEGVSRTACSRFSEPIVQSWAFQLCDALAYMHSRRFLHRDVKPENVMVMINKSLRNLILLDLNSACNLSEAESLTPAGSRLYGAPEVLLGGSPCERSDSWGAGLCMFFALSGRLPQRRDELWLGNAADVAERVVDLSGLRTSDNCKEFLLMSLTLDCDKRPLSAALLESPWLQDQRGEPNSVESTRCGSPLSCSIDADLSIELDLSCVARDDDCVYEFQRVSI